MTELAKNVIVGSPLVSLNANTPQHRFSFCCFCSVFSLIFQILFNRFFSVLILFCPQFFPICFFLLFFLIAVLFSPSTFIHLFPDLPCCFLFICYFFIFSFFITLFFLLLTFVLLLFSLHSFCYSSSSESSVFTFFFSFALSICFMFKHLLCGKDPMILLFFLVFSSFLFLFPPFSFCSFL